MLTTPILQALATAAELPDLPEPAAMAIAKVAVDPANWHQVRNAVRNRGHRLPDPADRYIRDHDVALWLHMTARRPGETHRHLAGLRRVTVPDRVRAAEIAALHATDPDSPALVDWLLDSGHPKVAATLAGSPTLLDGADRSDRWLAAITSQPCRVTRAAGNNVEGHLRRLIAAAAPEAVEPLLVILATTAFDPGSSVADRLHDALPTLHHRTAISRAGAGQILSALNDTSRRREGYRLAGIVGEIMLRVPATERAALRPLVALVKDLATQSPSAAPWPLDVDGIPAKPDRSPSAAMVAHGPAATLDSPALHRLLADTLRRARPATIDPRLAAWAERDPDHLTAACNDPAFTVAAANDRPWPAVPTGDMPLDQLHPLVAEADDVVAFLHQLCDAASNDPDRIVQILTSGSAAGVSTVTQLTAMAAVT